MLKYALPTASMLLSVVVSIAPAATQTTSITQLQANLQTAVCLNNWDNAIGAIDGLLASPIPSPYRQQLTDYRPNLEAYQSAGSRFDWSDRPECGGLGSAIQPSQIQPRQGSSINWERAIESVQHGSGRSGSVTGNSSSNSPSWNSGYSYGSSGSSGGGSGLCRVPSDIAADGSRCGRRAASER